MFVSNYASLVEDVEEATKRVQIETSSCIDQSSAESLLLTSIFKEGCLSLKDSFFYLKTVEMLKTFK